MKFRAALVAATCLGLPGLGLPVAAHAQPVTGPYVSLSGGTSLLEPTNIYFGGDDKGTVSPGLAGKYQFRPAYAAAGGIGYGFGNGFRVELGGDFMRNTANAADLHDCCGDSAHFAAGGAEQKYGPMFNVYYDINVGLPIFPYVGAGAGYQWVKYNSDLSTNFDEFGEGESIKTGGTQGSFAYDLIAGVAYPLPMLPQLSLTAEYRFMQLVQTRGYYSYLTDNVPGSATLDAGKTNIGQESSNTFLFGLRYQIFPTPVMAAAPPPAAAPAPAAAKTYLVFFDWDKYNLTPRATQIIAQAASDSHTQQVTTLNVSGYTDTSGTAQYNMGLSERRAKAVAAQLVADGVPASEISTHAFGETHLLVPTGPGVREPQNRRVEIVLN